jgi:hypothetical protein
MTEISELENNRDELKNVNSLAFAEQKNVKLPVKKKRKQTVKAVSSLKQNKPSEEPSIGSKKDSEVTGASSDDQESAVSSDPGSNVFKKDDNESTKPPKASTRQSISKAKAQKSKPSLMHRPVTPEIKEKELKNIQTKVCILCDFY